MSRPKKTIAGLSERQYALKDPSPAQERDLCSSQISKKRKVSKM